MGAAGVLFLYFLCPHKVALSLAYAQSAPSRPPGPLQITELHVPEAAGYIVETHLPAPSASTPTPPIIVQIQEAHTNYDAQQNIIQILEQLVEGYGLRLILVEGGTGDASLSYLRRHAPLGHRKVVAERYLKAGLLSAEEYLDMTSEAPLTVWGVEDSSLYEKNVDLFLRALKVRDAQQPTLQALRATIDTLRPSLLSAEVNALIDEAGQFEQRQVTVADYARILEQAAATRGIAPSAYPNVERFFALRHLEEAVVPAQAQREQRQLMAVLSTRLSEAEVEALLSGAASAKTGTVAAAAFYRAVESAAQAVGIELAAYPQLAHYMRYVKESAQVNTTALADELEVFAAHLSQQLASNAAGRQLLTILETVVLLDKLIRLDLSPAEYQQLHGMDLAPYWTQWDTFLQQQLKHAGLPPQSFAAGLRDLGAQLPTLWRFYEVAQERDEQLVANAVQQLQARGEPMAVLITGGFHGPRITELLKQRGVATLLLMPKVGRPTDERLYQAVIRYKNGQGGSLEEVMALADELHTRR
jgi:methylmalonyl-CoA mutase cobalamin-binding subunit